MQAQEELGQAEAFNQLIHVLNARHQDINNHLDIDPNDDQPFREFTSPDGHMSGSLLTFSGDIVDKLIHSKIDASAMGFGTMRLTIWLNSSIRVPHLTFEFGTIPNLFFYIDYIPRVDLWADINYVQTYYEPVKSLHAELRDRPNLSVFVSKNLYIRQLQSPAHICFTCSSTEDSLSLIESLSRDMCTRWLGWVEQAIPVPDEAQAALAERDLRMRRITAESDPGNAAAARIFGEEFTQQLVRALWQ